MIWRWLKKERNIGAWKLQEDMMSLATEINQAKQDWVHAQNQLDHALGKEQVDYAIFALEAAEKRYEMLLKEMKDNYREQKKSMPIPDPSRNGETL